jgi:diphthamide biosynthesis protein 7
MIDTVWPADSVEFCPHESASDIFVCGTYQLEQSPADIACIAIDGGDTIGNQSQVRHGKCLVYQTTGGRGA